MQLYEGEIGKTYIVEDMHMPLETAVSYTHLTLPTTSRV